MAKDASEFEQIPDVQDARRLYEIAREQAYGSPSVRQRYAQTGHPPPADAAFLQVMATALQVRQLCRLNVLLETLIQRESKPHE